MQVNVLVIYKHVIIKRHVHRESRIQQPMTHNYITHAQGTYAVQRGTNGSDVQFLCLKTIFSESWNLQSTNSALLSSHWTCCGSVEIFMLCVFVLYGYHPRGYPGACRRMVLPWLEEPFFCENQGLNWWHWCAGEVIQGFGGQVQECAPTGSYSLDVGDVEVRPAKISGKGVEADVAVQVCGCLIVHGFVCVSVCVAWRVHMWTGSLWKSLWCGCGMGVWAEPGWMTWSLLVRWTEMPM